jgi:DNA polymerase V
MENDALYAPSYQGTKQFVQQTVQNANATGFGAAADDYMERGIDLNEVLIDNKLTTFFFKMNSNAMEQAGIFAGDILIVDRSIKAASNKIIIAALNGELLVRRYKELYGTIWLCAENSLLNDIEISKQCNFKSWGVITYSIHPHLF